MKTRIFNLIIMDESGSMQIIKRKAIDSVNETIQTIRSSQKRHEEQEHFVSLVTFNNEVKTIYECVPIKEVKEITNVNYHPDCCTALYDAIGMSLNALRKKVSEGDKVLVTIVTDGYENASKEYNDKAIKALIDELKTQYWIFAYIGANQDVEKVATSISIANTLRFETTQEGISQMSEQLNSARSRLYDRIADCCHYTAEANETFFNKD